MRFPVAKIQFEKWFKVQTSLSLLNLFSFAANIAAIIYQYLFNFIFNLFSFAAFLFLQFYKKNK